MNLFERYGHHIIFAAAIALLVTGNRVAAVVVFVAGIMFVGWQAIKRNRTNK
ncbi:MAG: hypothetical protein HQ478_14860 [Chloroflexi bacterium]|nr:hypothetical protein [Chloroflexota bacterium]